mmetsp:Transcript_18904/g.26324  ORF Transcript_18904/g.26324 Transcript_18904/m.26324 type:complete len:80 (-) Transcript_18904:912-1151(-)
MSGDAHNETSLGISSMDVFSLQQLHQVLSNCSISFPPSFYDQGIVLKASKWHISHIGGQRRDSIFPRKNLILQSSSLPR